MGEVSVYHLHRLGRISHCCLTTPSHYRHQCWLTASGIHLRPTSQVVLWTLIREMSLKITLVKILPYLPGANELIIPILYRHVWRMRISYIDGLVQDWSMSSALAMEIPQSCTKLSIYSSSQNDKDIVGNKLNAFLNRWLNWSRTHQCPLNGQDQTPWISLKHRNRATFTGKHDAVIKWKHFPRYWPFVRGIHRSPVNSPAQRPVTRNFDVLFDLHLNKRFSKQWLGFLFETLSRSLWRHCYGNAPT